MAEQAIKNERAELVRMSTCIWCGYDASGLDGPQCPECGKAIEYELPDQMLRREVYVASMSLYRYVMAFLPAGFFLAVPLLLWAIDEYFYLESLLALGVFLGGIFGAAIVLVPCFLSLRLAKLYRPAFRVALSHALLWLMLVPMCYAMTPVFAFSIGWFLDAFSIGLGRDRGSIAWGLSMAIAAAGSLAVSPLVVKRRWKRIARVAGISDAIVTAGSVRTMTETTFRVAFWLTAVPAILIGVTAVISALSGLLDAVLAR
ncbi:MAG: hypothetical protein AAF747_10370 [Planctomycetota bacterium]